MMKKMDQHVFFRSEKAIGPARAGRAGKEKFEKFGLYELPAR